MKTAMEMPGGCRDLLGKCAAAGTSAEGNVICSSAWVFCVRALGCGKDATNFPLFKQNHILLPAIGNRSDTDLSRQNTDAPFPPPYYLQYVRSPDVMSRIGARTKFDQCSDPVKAAFTASGEVGRSSLGDMGELANAKFPILIWVRP